jgi:CBS domain containing-hemolysin-like protein
MAALLREGLAGKDHADDQGELIDRVFHVSETSIATVMVPWGRVRYLLPRTDRAGLSKVARASRHRRMPVWDPRLHRVTGMIDVDALLGVGGWRWVSERMEPMPVVEPTTTVASAIVALQSSPHDFALITGRGERPLGIVTLNGLVNTVLHGLQPDI